MGEDPCVRCGSPMGVRRVPRPGEWQESEGIHVGRWCQGEERFHIQED